MADHNRYKVIPNKFNPKTDPGQTIVYQVRIKGYLGSQWSEWFEGQTITLDDNGDTLITGPVVDQAALYGLLKKVRDIGLQLVSLTQVQSD
jgi:hypothetical protein